MFNMKRRSAEARSTDCAQRFHRRDVFLEKILT
jgi:hypothetical protein